MREDARQGCDCIGRNLRAGNPPSSKRKVYTPGQT